MAEHSEIFVLCRSCRDRLRCSRRSELHRLSVMAWAHDAETVDCADYHPRWYRGIDGVYVHASPFPSRVSSGNQIRIG